MRQVHIHESNEALVVRRLKQVDQLVHHDVFQAFGWLLGEVGVQPYVTGYGRATAPLCLHSLHEYPLCFHTERLLPFLQQCGYGVPDLLSIPALKCLFALCPIRAWPYPKQQGTWREIDGWRSIDELLR